MMMTTMTDRDPLSSSTPPSSEARDAIARARHARQTTEAVLPVAEQLRDRVRSALAANHFVELMEQSLREAAARRARSMLGKT
jgi:hypothetical protein